MKNRITILLLIGIGISHSVSAQDPCNFNTGDETFSYDQVKACYESVPFRQQDLANIVEASERIIETADLRETYDALVGWRDNLDDVESGVYGNDFTLQQAAHRMFRKFQNGHFFYSMPSCYRGLFAAFVPFDFGSTMHNGEQIIFVESLLVADLYENHTGIDPQRFVGQRVVSIDGLDPLEFFRKYGQDELMDDANDGVNLMGVLSSNNDYSVRFGSQIFPEAGSHTYVFAKKNGKQTSVEIPFVYGKVESVLAALGDDVDLGILYPNNSTEFESLCFRPPAPIGFGANGSGEADLMQAGVPRKIIKKQRMKAHRAAKARRGGDFFEVPEGQLDKHIRELSPKVDAIRVVEYKNRTTAIQLDDFTSELVTNFRNEIGKATEYACENSDNLIIDLRTNGGGQVFQVQYLARHLFPDDANPGFRGFFYKQLADLADDNPDAAYQLYRTNVNELGANRAFGLGDICLGQFNSRVGPFCALDPNQVGPSVDPGDVYGLTQTQIDRGLELDLAAGVIGAGFFGPYWSEGNPTFEVRGDVLEVLSPIFSPIFLYNPDATPFLFPPYDQPFYRPISCPGKFAGDNLLVITNGQSFSAAYFTPEKLRGKVTLVTTGGFAGESIALGAARGGSVISLDTFLQAELFLDSALAGLLPPANLIPRLNRDGGIRFENTGAYNTDLVTLSVDNESLGDVHVDVWSDSDETDGFVYGRVLKAVRKWRGER